MIEAYLPILQCLIEAEVQYCVIGTWALKAYFPDALQHYPIRDCDIVLLPTLENIQKAHTAVQQAGWQASVWGLPIPIEADALFWAGKFYIRATNADLVLDMTYECKIDWDIMATENSAYSSIPLASVTNILALKRMKAEYQNTVEEFEKFLALLAGK